MYQKLWYKPDNNLRGHNIALVISTIVCKRYCAPALDKDVPYDSAVADTVSELSGEWAYTQLS